MSIGERIYAARRAAGLSQRQLAGEAITRNMLSLLEHDQAKPSLETLRYLSAQLDRPVSYFLGEDNARIPGLDTLRAARQAWTAGDFRQAAELADQVRDGEEVHAERELIWAEATLAEAERLRSAGAEDAARLLLERAESRMGKCPYGAAGLLQRRAVLLAETARTARELETAVQALPDVDEILLLRAKAALQAGEAGAAGRTLDAVQNRETPRWMILRGDAYAAAEAWEQALDCYLQAEQAEPGRMRRAIGSCYAKLGNFEQAYRYASME